MKKILIIAYPFPPIPYSGTYRIIRICKGLDFLNTEVHGLSIKINKKIPNDFDLIDKLPSNMVIHRSFIPDPWIRYQYWRKNKKNNIITKIINKLLSLIFRLISIPDHQIFWIPFAYLKARKIAKNYKINNVLISAPPYSSLIIGYLLKRMDKVRWISDLRDPIVGNIAAVHLRKPTDIFSKIELKVLIKLEKFVVRHSDIIISNTATNKDELISKYTQKNIIAVHNSFDPEDYKNISSKKYNKFTISHLGSIYGLRKVDILFDAIVKFKGKYKNEKLEFVIQFVGFNDPALKELIEQYALSDYVKIMDIVPHADALKIMIKSHMLLLVKATGEGSYGQIPAKFFEYLGTRNKILCIGPKKSEVANIINDLDVGYVFEEDDNGLSELLNKYYTDYLNKRLEFNKNGLIDNYNNINIAEKIKQILE
jgi:hypothetical protein